MRLGPFPDHAPDHANNGDRRKVLYVEDNLSNLRLVERLLESRPDVEIVAAMQGRMGLELARQHEPAVILLDLHLPDMPGADVLRELRDDPTTASIPVIIVTSQVLEQTDQDRLLAEADSVISKQALSRELAINRIRDALRAIGRVRREES